MSSYLGAKSCIRDKEIYKAASEILHGIYGEDAEFREGQYEAIEATLLNRRTLVVQRTGWGKSLVYFTCTKFLRERGSGVSMVVSPLLVLMQNQSKTNLLHLAKPICWPLLMQMHYQQILL